MGETVLITPTGDRPEAFALLERWISRQTVKPGRWIVIDDGQIQTQTTRGQEVVRRTPQKNDPRHTLPVNLAAALDLLGEGDRILIVEDDDFYSPAYVETVLQWLETADLVGEGLARYYHVQARKFCRFANFTHASLAQTAFKGAVIPELRKILRNVNEYFVDLKLWSVPGISRTVYTDATDSKRLHCGMKGLPGRRGIAVGHDPGFSDYTMDQSFAQLRRWIGPDAEAYVELSTRGGRK